LSSASQLNCEVGVLVIPVVGFPSGSIVARQNCSSGLPALLIKVFLGGLGNSGFVLL